MNAPKMRILIVDDEPLARERLASLIRELGVGEVVGEAGNGIEALTAIAAHAPQLVLLDIRMPGMDGLEAAQHMAYYEPPPAVIFTTAFGDYALEAFERYHQRVCKKVKAMYPFCSNQQRTGWQAREKGAHRHERAKHRRG